MPDPMPNPADPGYTLIISTALTELHFATLRVAAAQAVASMWADAQSPPSLLRWLNQHANTADKIDENLKKYLVFIVTHPTVLDNKGALNEVPIATLKTLVTGLLQAFVSAEDKAKGA